MADTVEQTTIVILFRGQMTAPPQTVSVSSYCCTDHFSLSALMKIILDLHLLGLCCYMNFLLTQLSFLVMHEMARATGYVM